MLRVIVMREIRQEQFIEDFDINQSLLTRPETSVHLKNGPWVKCMLTNTTRGQRSNCEFDPDGMSRGSRLGDLLASNNDLVDMKTICTTSLCANYYIRIFTMTELF